MNDRLKQIALLLHHKYPSRAMNYLAHLYLAGNNRGLLVGGFIADAVKGRQIELYNSDVVAGIRLHRAIDKFTDEHFLIGTGKQALRGRFGKFSGIVMDMFGDHYLAKNWANYSDYALHLYSDNIYERLREDWELMPERSQHTLHYMHTQDWLYNYRHIEGIKRALSGLAQRSKFVSGMENAHEELVENDSFYHALFAEFLPELIRFVNSYKEMNISTV
jgi:acyl carrier protein phosphodiesterase